MNQRPTDKLNSRKLKSLSGLGALGFMMLFQYQNCAPAPHSMSASKATDDGIVSTIDDVNLTTGVSFTQTKVQVGASEDTIIVDGECSLQQQGAVIGWKVHDSAGRLRDRGYADCDQGKIKVEVDHATELECDQSYLLSAQLAAGSAATAEVRRDCATQASASGSSD